LDFEQLRRRLHESRETVETLDDASAVEEILRRRSRELAAKRLEASEREVLSQVIIARRCNVLIAVPIASTGEVRRLKRFDLPGANEVIIGVFQIRGRSHCLVDLAPLIGETAPARNGTKPLVMLISGPPGELGLEIDEVIGARTIYTDEIASGLHEQRAGFISHVTRDLVHIIDTRALMALPEVRIGRQ
jgi:chemotaxis signal transduction protein